MIYNYEILNPLPVKDKPRYSSKGELLVPNIKSSYKWYLEAARNNTKTCDREYFLLFGDTKFNHSCKRIYNYGGIASLYITGEFKDFVDREISSRGNIEVEFVECEDDFDVWRAY